MTLDGADLDQRSALLTGASLVVEGARGGGSFE